MTDTNREDASDHVESYDMASLDDLPNSFYDPACKDFITVCSGGFEGDISIGSIFLHNCRDYPQCFGNGLEKDSTCTIVLLRRLPTERK